MASPRTVHFQRSFSQASACDGHLGGPNTRVPEEVTCSECWEIVKDQARRRHELNTLTNDRVHLLSVTRFSMTACGGTDGAVSGKLDRVTCEACKKIALTDIACATNEPRSGSTCKEMQDLERANQKLKNSMSNVPPVRTVHIADSDDAPVCGLTDACDVTLDPMAATCVVCKRVHELTIKKIVHLYEPGATTYCGQLPGQNEATNIPVETTCSKCMEEFNAKLLKMMP
jgi:hypothetical protein